MNKEGLIVQVPRTYQSHSSGETSPIIENNTALGHYQFLQMQFLGYKSPKTEMGNYAGRPTFDEVSRFMVYFQRIGCFEGKI